MKDHDRFNFTINVLESAFFGFALGTASFVAIIPLFVNSMTDSATLIGLIPAIHTVGWQLPQLLTSEWVSRLSRYKPLVLFMTIHERLPYFGLAAVAWYLPVMPRDLSLALTFFLLIWQGLGGGLTATAWQSLIGKIIPADRHGLFFGIQAAAANLLASGGAVLAAYLLESRAEPGNYAQIFIIAGLGMMVSWVILSLTREARHSPGTPDPARGVFWNDLRRIIRQDINFRWFLSGRMLAQVATMAQAFFTVYAVRQLGISAGTAGLMAGVFAAAQIAANPLLGWLGDRWGNRIAIEVGVLAAFLSTLIALWAPVAGWFYLVFTLAGVANAALWTIVLAMTLKFGDLAERPKYIGLSNTLVAPITFLAPITGGWLADTAGFKLTFLISALGGLAALIVFRWFVQDPVLRFSPIRVPIQGD